MRSVLVAVAAAAVCSLGVVGCVAPVADEAEEDGEQAASALGCFVCREHDEAGGGFGHGGGGGSAPAPPCPPDTDCVDAPSRRVPTPSANPDGPRSRALDRIPGVGGAIERSAPQATHIECPVPGPACQTLCTAAGAPCNGARLHDTAGVGFGLLTSCRTGLPTYTCSFRYGNGELCSQVFIRGNIPVSPVTCASK